MVFKILFCPLIWFFNSIANILFKFLKLTTVRNDDITSDDIYAGIEAGAVAGLLLKEEHQLIENIFQLEECTVSSSITTRKILFILIYTKMSRA